MFKNYIADMKWFWRYMFKKETSLLWKLAWATILFGSCVIGFGIGHYLYWFVKGLIYGY